MTVVADQQDARIAAIATRRRESFTDQIAMFTGLYDDWDWPAFPVVQVPSP